MFFGTLFEKHWPTLCADVHKCVNISFRLVHISDAVAQLVEAQRYKPKGCGFDSRWGHWNFSVA